MKKAYEATGLSSGKEKTLETESGSTDHSLWRIAFGRLGYGPLIRQTT
jgi:hypothetical protein